MRSGAAADARDAARRRRLAIGDPHRGAGHRAGAAEHEPPATASSTISSAPRRSSGSSASVRDNEGSAYVARDDSLWMVDDNSNSAYEIDRSTGALRRRISESEFAGAPRLGVEHQRRLGA